MTNIFDNQEVVKISAKPFIVIAILLTLFIFLGSIANTIRMKNRFDSLVDHSRVIYNAHRNTIETIFRQEESVAQIKNKLDGINGPEKGVYKIDLIRKVNGSWILYGSNVDKTNISQKDIDLLNKYVALDIKQQFRFQKNLEDFYNLFYKPYPYHNRDFLISVIPINLENEVVGYFIVATSKVQVN